MTQDSGILRIATRESELALWQARHVQQLLQAAHDGLVVELLPMTTEGDQRLAGSLSQVGGKGLFVKELEQALLDGRADLAVHSMKDVPAYFPDGLGLHAVLDGANANDAFVSNDYARLADLPDGARVGTASLRRQSQLNHCKPGLRIDTLRGNVNTRLRKLDEGQYDAIILACAGLQRLGMPDRIRQELRHPDFLPAIGQGIIGIECRSLDENTRELILALHDHTTAIRLTAERAMGAALNASCRTPLAGHALVRHDRIIMHGRIGMPDGSRMLSEVCEGTLDEAAATGRKVAQKLLARGAADILRDLGQTLE